MNNENHSNLSNDSNRKHMKNFERENNWTNENENEINQLIKENQQLQSTYINTLNFYNQQIIQLESIEKEFQEFVIRLNDLESERDELKLKIQILEETELFNKYGKYDEGSMIRNMKLNEEEEQNECILDDMNIELNSNNFQNDIDDELMKNIHSLEDLSEIKMEEEEEFLEQNSKMKQMECEKEREIIDIDGNDDFQIIPRNEKSEKDEKTIYIISSEETEFELFGNSSKHPSQDSSTSEKKPKRCTKKSSKEKKEAKEDSLKMKKSNRTKEKKINKRNQSPYYQLKQLVKNLQDDNQIETRQFDSKYPIFTVSYSSIISSIIDYMEENNLQDSYIVQSFNQKHLFVHFARNNDIIQNIVSSLSSPDEYSLISQQLYNEFNHSISSLIKIRHSSKLPCVFAINSMNKRYILLCLQDISND